MSWSQLAVGNLTTVTGTEHFLYNNTGFNGTMVGHVTIKNMQAGDGLRFRVYRTVNGTFDTVYDWTLTGAPVNGNIENTVPLDCYAGGKISIARTAGVNRSYDYEVNGG